MPLTLKIHNTLEKRKEEFIPADSSHVRMYTCGPTVYNYAHIGNARPAVISDLLVRVLRCLYPKVTFASNITDIDDKIINASKETGVPINEITEKNEVSGRAIKKIERQLPNTCPLVPKGGNAVVKKRKDYFKTFLYYVGILFLLAVAVFLSNIVYEIIYFKLKA